MSNVYVTSDCEHEYGYYYLPYEGWWPIEHEKDIDMAKAQDACVIFNYCPHCGEKL